MTGELLSKAYVRSIVPRSTEKLMEYVSTELGEECACPLRIGDVETESLAPVEDNDLTLGAQLLYSFPHGSL